MKILALELSTARGSFAWLDGETELARDWPNDRKNSAVFFENLDNVVKKFGAAQIIVVGLGPGSYAGTRIAISAAIGLQVASGARLIGLPSICAIEAADYCVIGDARRKSFFFAHICSNAPISFKSARRPSASRPAASSAATAVTWHVRSAANAGTVAGNPSPT